MIKPCKHCGKRFEQNRTREQKFCSHACAYANVKSQRPTIACLTCGKVVTVSPSDIDRGRKFCSVNCRAIAEGRGAPNATRMSKAEIAKRFAGVRYDLMRYVHETA